jgi:phosphoribosylformimino-5-aminoimidazole carboxamide ribotide isomerase
LHEIYVADLNAIQGSSPSRHRDIIAALARGEKISILLDAGIPDVETALQWLGRGVRKVVIGSETLGTWDALRDIPAGIAPDRLIFSLDLVSGKVLSRCAALAARTPFEVLDHLQHSGWSEIILLDLKRVGSGKGADYSLAAEARTIFPALHLLIGGGIAKAEELMELKSIGIAGVLVATALHQGIIDPQCVSSLEAK